MDRCVPSLGKSLLQQFSGMIGSVMAGDVDIAVADITQTALRETAVDFTVPFDQVGMK